MCVLHVCQTTFEGEARFLGDVELGYLAELHPLVLHELDIPHAGAIFELDVDRWRSQPGLGPRYQRLPRYPSVTRDFAVVVQESTPARTVRQAVAEASELIVAVEFMSLYRGAGMADGHKCVAWSATLRHDDRTLTEPDIREAEQAVWAAVATVGGTRRA